MIYKLLITDVDLTLIPFDNALPSKKVTDAIKKVREEKKTKIILATSRPFNKIKKICEHLNLSDFVVASGGAEIIDLQRNKPYKEYVLPNEKIDEVAKIITDFDKTIDFWIQDNGIDCRYTKTYVPQKPFVFVAHHLSKKQAHDLSLHLSHTSGIFCTEAVPYNKTFVDLNITHEHGTKQKSIEMLRTLFNIKKEEVIGVGDGYNDVAFLSSCGVKVAMGNAVKPVKEIADYIAPGVKKDGLATVIEKYLLLPQ